MAVKAAIFTYLQIICTILAIIFNSFLIYVVGRTKKSIIGAYKYLLIIFALFEMTYALVVLVGMPINYIAAKSWVVFNYDGIIGGTSFNWLGPTLYCTFYELWMGLVVVHFIYRYIVVCRINLKRKIEDSWKWKALFASFYAIHFLYAVICGMYYCTRSEMSQKIQDKIREDFDVQEPENIGFILLRILDLKGEINVGGLISILNHYLLVFLSVVIIGFCGVNIWLAIRRIHELNAYHRRDLNLQRQMFTTLLIQTTIPFLLCHLPTLIYLVGTSPFVNDDFSFGAISSIFSLLTAVPKVLDPLVVLYCIREYRRAALNILGCGSLANRMVGTVSGSSEGRYHSHGASLKHEHHGIGAENDSKPHTVVDALERGEIRVHGMQKPLES